MEDKYRDLADSLLKENAERNSLFAGVDDVFYGRWLLPPGMPDWVQKVVATDGHDAALTATRVMSQSKNLRIKVMPLLNDGPNQDRANSLAAALKWNLLRANRSSESSILWEAAFSSVQYSSPVVQVMYLPYQEKVLETMGKDTKRIKALKKRGDFAFLSHNPANVYPLYSMYGLEAILVVKVQTIDEFKKEWGKLAKIKDGKYVTSYDYWDHEKRIVWGVSSGDKNIARNRALDGKLLDGVEIINGDNELGFIPFSIRRWGNSLSTDSAEKYSPLLGTIWTSKQWDMLNIYLSMDSTLAWKRAAKPVGVHKSPTGEPVRMDYTEPASTIEIGSGEDFTPLPPDNVDARLSSQYSNFRNMMWQSTIARNLQSLEFPSGSAYSSINQLLSAATSSLAPYKTLTEDCLADVCTLMLCWVSYYGDKYGAVDLYGEYDRSKAGQAIRISSDTIVPEDIRVEVTMTPDVPLDEQAMMNTAVLAKREFNIPEEDLLESVGYQDIADMRKRRSVEDIETAYIQLELKKLDQAQELQFQTALAEMQAGIQQQAQQQAQEQQMAQAEQAAKPITENAGGLGGNPAAGGTPPIQAAPGQAM